MTQVQYPGARTSLVTFGDRVQAFLAVPERGTPPYGAVVLGHERYGLVQHTLDLTAKFAAHGYVAIAPDMFSRWDGDKAALNRGDIQVPLSDADVRAYMGDSVDYLHTLREVDPARIAAMGVCQSGDYPLVLNSVRPEIAANVVVYGAAQPSMWELSERRPEPYEDILARITAPVLGIWGESDHVIPVDGMLRLRNTLEKHRKTYEFKLWRDMPHGWLNDTMPGRYRPKEAEEAWALIIDFLGRVFAGAIPRDRVTWRFESDIAVDYDFSKAVRHA
ncbi:MAG TPA: dienelactone hydrolase family protein [Chloroflexota bacterium]|nr:dienelactone hydrolase family protein [Chloroflexota bacterium]